MFPCGGVQDSMVVLPLASTLYFLKDGAFNPAPVSIIFARTLMYMGKSRDYLNTWTESPKEVGFCAKGSAG